MNIKTWQTMKIGTSDLQMADDFHMAFRAADCKIDDRTRDMLNQPGFTVSAKRSKVELVKVSVAELGFLNEATLVDIYASAMEQCLALCPPEVGPRLRLKYKNQPVGEWLQIAMEPIIDSDGDLSVWELGHDDSGPRLQLKYSDGDGYVWKLRRAGYDHRLWLKGCCGRPGNPWRTDSQWVFIRCKAA